MSTIGRVHHKYVFRRRVQRLASILSPAFPANATVLDVGCGDGSVAKPIMEQRRQWRQCVDELGGTVVSWETDLKIYPPPLAWFFDRGLHVAFTIRKRPLEPGE